MSLLNHRLSKKCLALIASGIVLGILVYHGHFCFSVIGLRSSVQRSEKLPAASEKDTQKYIPIPPEYGILHESADGNSPGICSDTASAEYLRDFRTHAVEHCSSMPGDSISCFHGTKNGQNRDLFCIARGVVLDEEAKRFSLECDSGRPAKGSPGAALNLDDLKRNLGPGAVFDRYFNMGGKPKDLVQPILQVKESQLKRSNYTILIKREGTASFWDTLMEIMAMTLSVDVLRMSSDMRLEDSFITVPADLPRTQVIILDELPEGPLYDLWSFFAGSAPIRLRDVIEDKTRIEALLSAHAAVVPLPGSSNPLSKIDHYDVPDCRYSGLARTFARRVLRHYGVLHPQGVTGVSKVFRVTVVAGTGTRRIRDTDHLLQALLRAFPNVIAREVDFAAIPMKDQLQVVQSTDVLVGAHGAGLSHTMFMRHGEGAVVEIQPAEASATQHQARYKNLAAVLGRKYFMAEAEVVPLGQAGSWHADVEQGYGGDKPHAVETELAKRNTELVVSEDEFVAQVGRAIEALVQGQA